MPVLHALKQGGKVTLFFPVPRACARESRAVVAGKREEEEEKPNGMISVLYLFGLSPCFFVFLFFLLLFLKLARDLQKYESYRLFTAVHNRKEKKEIHDSVVLLGARVFD